MAFLPANLTLWSAPPVPPNYGLPQWWGYVTKDTMATVGASGYFNLGGAIFPINTTFFVGDQLYCVCADGVASLQIATVGATITTTASSADIPAGSITTAMLGANIVTGPKLATTLTSTAGITTNFSTSSATPGTIRAWVGQAEGTATTMTSGDLVGVRGEVDMVGASGGFAYGVQGKVIPTGTLSGSVWAPAVFGQYDLSGATINAGQIAAIWGDMGATGGTFTNVTGARLFAGTNTISSLTLFAMDYRYGKASNLFELDGNAGTYITSGGSGAPSGTIKKIAISIDGVQYYMVAATTVS